MRTLVVLALVGCGQEVARASQPAELCPPVAPPAQTLVEPTTPATFDWLIISIVANTFVSEIVTTTYRAARRWTRPLYRIVFPIGPKLGPWPRLADRGFENLTAKQMATPASLQRAFSGLQVVENHGDLHILEHDDTMLADVGVTEGASNTVRIEGPGIETIHGLQIGSPLANVLKLRVPHRCETIYHPIHSGLDVHGAVRCRVGRGAHFRYVVQLRRTLPPVADATPELAAMCRGPLETVPDDGPELERWIETSGRKIDLILWERW
ncbi:MAG: hypothetical protein SFX73_18765 [Kofleriaceae bacterium]|nr:hypothetical protein [Kofleriaceae bacterium]